MSRKGDMTTTYDPATRKRCVGPAWRRDRRVRILAEDFGYKNKIGTIRGVGEKYVYVEVRYGKKPDQWDEIAYLPKNLRLI
jgi:hypothetical protein